MLELHIPDSEVQSGTVPVSWCVDKSTLKTLAEKDVAEPYLLLVISPQENYSKQREVRKLVPLRDLMTFVEFHAPGVNRIFGLIVWVHHDVGKKALRPLQECYLRRFYGRYDTDMLEEDGDEILEGRRTYDGMTEVNASLDVTMPRECFAKEPPEWEQRWVNMAWRSMPEDQCDYRRRRLWAYSGQVVIGAIVYAFRLAAALFLLLLFGLRKIDFGSLLHPLRCVTSDIWSDAFEEGDEACGTYFVPKWTKRRFRYLFLAFMPALVIPMFLILKYGVGFSASAASLWALAGIAAVIATLAAAVIGLIAFLERRADRKKARPAEDPWYAREEEMRYLVCGSNVPRGLKDLPKSRRTIRLRFLDFKARVCRPFAR